MSNIFFPILNFAYASRILGPEGIGKVQFVVAFATYFVVLAQIGVPVYGLREIAKLKNDIINRDKLFSELLGINLLSSLLFAFVYFGVVLSFHWFYNTLNYFLLGGLMVLSGFAVLDWFYMAMEQFRFLSWRSVSIKIIALSALFLFVNSKNDLTIYFFITLFSVIAVNIWNLLHLKGQVTIHFREINFAKHLRPLFVLYISSLTISVYTLGDTLLLGFLTSDRFVGLYTAAKKLVIIIIPLITSLGTVLIPKMAQSLFSENTHETHRRVKQSFSFICLFGIPVSVGIAVFAPEIIRLFSGVKFLGAVFTLQLIAPVIFLVGLGHLFGMQLLIPGGFEKQYFWATAVGMVISIVLNMVLIHFMKDKGAALTLVVTEAVVTFIAYFFVIKKMQLSVNWFLAIKAFSASLLFIPVRLLFQQTKLPYYFAFSLAVMVSVLLYFFIQLFFFKEPLTYSVLNGIFKTGKT